MKTPVTTDPLSSRGPAGARRSGVGGVLVYLGAPADGPVPDLPGLARAVERLVHSLAPDVVTRVTVAVPPPVPARVPLDAAPGGAAPGDPDDPGADPSGRTALADGLWLDRASRTLEAEGRRLTLTRREFELLAYLERRRGVAVSRRELMTHVWGGGYLAGDRTIDVHIRRLRVKLGGHRDRIITLRGYGYRFD